MGLNRFSTVGTSEYTPQHVPLPFEEISAIGEKMQKKYDTAIDDTYKLKDLMAQVPAINDPNLGLSNVQKKKELDAQYSAKINELTDKIVNGDANAFQELEKVKRDLLNDPTRQELENSYLDYQAYKKDMIDKKDAYAVYKDPYRNKKLINDEGELQAFRYSGMGERQDHSTEARAQMAGVATSGIDSKNSYLDPNDGNIYTKTSKGTYVKNTRIRDLANEKAGDFVKTQKGQDYLELLKYENPEATSEQLFKGVSDYLFNAGSNQIFSNFGGGSDVQTTGITSKIYDENKELSIQTTNEQGNAESVDVNTVLSSWGLDGVLDKEGNIAQQSNLKTSVVDGPGLMRVPLFLFNQKSAGQIVNEAYEKMMPVFKSLGLKRINGESVPKIMYDYAQKVAIERSTTTQLQQSTTKGMTDFFLGDNSNISNMEVYEQGNENSNAKLTNEVMSSLAKNSKITGVDYFGNNQTGWKVAVTPKDKSGNISGQDQALIAIPKDLSFASETKPVWKISKGALEFAKTGKENSEYQDNDATPVIESVLKTNYGANAPKIVASSTDRNKKGEIILRGSYVDNSNNQAELKAIEYNVAKQTFELLSLGEIQKRKTREIETQGSLKQYNIKLGETIKDSEVNQ
jgi:hypothetical protein